MSEERATILTSLSPEEHSSITWSLVAAKMRRGEGLKETLLWAIRNCVELPPDPHFRAWLAVGLEGTLDPKRGRGRPRKHQQPDFNRASVEGGIRTAYDDWLKAFQRDRECAWLRAEARRLRDELPDAPVWRHVHDLGREDGRKSFKVALAELGARPCPLAGLQGAETARDLALDATMAQWRSRWKDLTGMRLTLSVIRRIVTRANNSD
jgi:hypothetical protein